MQNDTTILYNQQLDRLKRLEMHYQRCQDEEIKALLYDEIIYVKHRLRKLEQEICQQIEYEEDYAVALNLLERIYN